MKPLSSLRKLLKNYGCSEKEIEAVCQWYNPKKNTQH
jgi:hypothetical protein